MKNTESCQSLPASYLYTGCPKNAYNSDELFKKKEVFFILSE
jgi:hypothetical protein